MTEHENMQKDNSQDLLDKISAKTAKMVSESLEQKEKRRRLEETAQKYASSLNEDDFSVLSRLAPSQVNAFKEYRSSDFSQFNEQDLNDYINIGKFVSEMAEGYKAIVQESGYKAPANTRQEEPFSFSNNAYNIKGYPMPNQDNSDSIFDRYPRSQGEINHAIKNNIDPAMKWPDSVVDSRGDFVTGGRKSILATWSPDKRDLAEDIEDCKDYARRTRNGATRTGLKISDLDMCINGIPSSPSEFSNPFEAGDRNNRILNAMHSVGEHIRNIVHADSY